MKNRNNIKIGDTVGYSAKWLRSISAITGDLPRAKGVVTAVDRITDTLALAIVDWDIADIPPKVNINNLARVRTLAWVEDV
jgi:hypothetical protein